MGPSDSLTVVENNATITNGTFPAECNNYILPPVGIISSVLSTRT